MAKKRDYIEKAKSLPINGLIHGSQIKGGHVLDCVFLDCAEGRGIYINGDPDAQEKGEPRFVARGVTISRSELGEAVIRLRSLPKKPPLWRFVSRWRWHRERYEAIKQVVSPSYEGEGRTLYFDPGKEGPN